MTPSRAPYVDYDVLTKWDTPSWDDQTREVIRKRLVEIPERTFFTEDEWQTLESICARGWFRNPNGRIPFPSFRGLMKSFITIAVTGFATTICLHFASHGVSASRESTKRVVASSARSFGRSLRPTKMRCSEPFKPARFTAEFGHVFQRSAFSPPSF